MSARKMFWKVRDALVEIGLVSRPRFYLERHEPGTVRSRCTGRGSRRRTRRVSLARLLR